MKPASLHLGLAFALWHAALASADDVKHFGLTGDWGGLRTDLQKAGVGLGATYSSVLAYNATGGTDNLFRHADQLALTGNLDLERLLGLHDAQIRVLITNRNGRSLSEDAHLGTFQPVQEVYGRDQTWRLTQFWYDQKYFSGVLDWKIGRMWMGEDFASFSCIFQNLVFCGAIPGKTVGNYWLNWPISQWATRIKVNLDPEFSVQAGAFEVNPRFLDKDDAFLPTFPSGATGAMVPVEFAWTPKFGDDRLAGSYKIGAWYDTSDAPDVFDDVNGDPVALTGLPFKTRHGRYGAYLAFQQEVMRFGEADSGRGLNLFFNITQTDRRTSRTDNQIVLGFVAKGPFDLRPKDEIGLAIGRTHVNSRVTRAEKIRSSRSSVPVNVQHSEYEFELFYGLQATDWLMARPTIQYIQDPGGTDHNKDALVLGLKTQIEF